MNAVRWMFRGGLALVVLLVLAWVTLGAQSWVAGAIAALSVGAVVFIVAELLGVWPERQP